MGNLTTTLSLTSNVYGGGKGQQYTTSNPVTSAFDTTFKVNNSDSFKQLIDFKSDGTKTYNKFNYLLLANDGEQPAEMQILLREFNTGTDLADANPESATIDFILHPGKYFVLPTAKMMVYSTDPDDDDVYAASDTSAGNKDGTSAYGVAYATTGPTFIDPPGYFIASQTNGNPVGLTASSNLFDADIEEDFFKNQMMGNTTTGHAEADHIALFGECHADDVGTLQDISALGSSTDFANAKITLGSITADKASGTTMFLGAYASIARLTGAHTASQTTITFENNAGGSPSSDGQMFKKFDIIRIGNELMQIIDGVPHQTTFTVKRGVLGTTAVAHEDHDAIGFHYMHNTLEYLDRSDGTSKAATAGCTAMKGVSNIYTSQIGSFSANTFFGLGRSFSFPNGLVPGSIAIKFYSNARLGLGMRGITSSTKTGLAASTAYEFKITVDGGTQTVISFTTDASNLTFGSSAAGTGVLRKIQTALNNASIDATIGLIAGDVVLSGKTRYRGLSSIAVAAGSDGAVAELFGTGKFPLTTAIKALISPDTPIDSDIDNIMFDDGLGRLRRASGGIGYINYETGAFALTGCPINSHMKIACSFNSALSGAIKSSRNNIVPVVKARSLNAFRDAYIRVVAYDDGIDDDNVETLMNSTESHVAGFKQESNIGSGGY